MGGQKEKKKNTNCFSFFFNDKKKKKKKVKSPMVEEKEGREGVYAETAPAAAERLKLEGAHTADGSAEM